MNNRLTTLDLCKILADKTGKDIELINRFVKELLELLSTSVNKDTSIEIKGLGVFKAQYIDDRESVNIHTNERFLIPSHLRYVFAPDKKLRDTVNKPFAFFESVELAEGVTMEDLTVSEEEAEADDNEELYDDSQPITIVPETEIPLPDEPVESEGEEVVTHTLDEEAPASIEPTEKEVEVEEEALDAPVFEEEQVEESEEMAPEEAEEPESEPLIEEEKEEVHDSDEAKAEEIKDEPIDEPEEAEVYEEEIERSDNKKMLLTIFSIAIITLVGIYFYKNGLPGTKEIVGANQPSGATDTIRTEQLLSDNIASDTALITGSTITSGLDIQPQDNKEIKSSIHPDKPVAEKKENPVKPVKKEEKKEVQEVKKSTPTVIAKETVQTGDLLTKFALKYYGKKAFWVYIYEHNKKVIKNPHNVPIGTVLEIPAPHLYGIDAKNKTSVEKALKKQTELAADTFK